MMRIKLLILPILLLSGCETLHPPTLMPAELQAARLIGCASLNLDHQVITNKLQQVIDITCIPKYNYDYSVIRLKDVPEMKPVEDKKE